MKAKEIIVGLMPIVGLAGLIGLFVGSATSPPSNEDERPTIILAVIFLILLILGIILNIRANKQ